MFTPMSKIISRPNNFLLLDVASHVYVRLLVVLWLLYTGLVADELQELVLAEPLDVQLGGLIELGLAHILAHHQVVEFLRYARHQADAVLLHDPLAVVPLERVEHACDQELEPILPTRPSEKQSSGSASSQGFSAPSVSCRPRSTCCQVFSFRSPKVLHFSWSSISWSSMLLQN